MSSTIHSTLKTALFLSIIFMSLPSFAQPTGFVDDIVSNEYNLPNGITFDKQGRMFVWEKGGKVFITDNNQRQATPIIDISEEVLNFTDHGLNGFALDPKFESNGYIYLLYAVKRHHLLYFGTPNYDPNNKDDFKTSIGRLTRYKLNKVDGIWQADLQSRKILLGESISTGIPILVDNHGVGSIVFSDDGTLLVSTGDASLIDLKQHDDDKNSWFLEAVNLGIITESQNISGYRSQSLESLNGKILRIDPETGNGVSSNPFYASASPRSAQSRIWALGLRNPFRFSIKPNTASTKPEDGKPGTLFVGDVGWTSREELNIVTKGGQNFGWPCYEGMDLINKYYQDPQYLPKNHQKPSINWRGPAAQGMINGEAYDVGSPQFKGEAFKGIASIGGLWYTGTTFPSNYQNQYFHGDYEGWIKLFGFDANLSPKSVEHFVSDVHPTCFAVNPKDGGIYYVNYFYPSIMEIRKLVYDPEGNRRPISVISADRTYGNTPFFVQFSASKSSDPEKLPLSYQWDFGDGTGSTEANPSHLYETGDIKSFTVTLKVTDKGDKSASQSMDVFINNTPPKIISTSIDNINSFENGKDLLVKLDAQVVDNEQSKIEYFWSVVLHHDDHSHFQTGLSTQQGEITLASVPCDGQSYWYEIQLRASDPLWLSSYYTKMITPKCNSQSTPLSLSPNPTESTVDLISDEEFQNKFITVRLVNINGRVIIEKSGIWSEIHSPISHEVAKQNAGIYLLNVTNDTFSKTFRIIKN